MILKEGGQKRTHPANEGRTVKFTRYDPLTIITSPLGEASNPVTCPINLSSVSMTLSEYGMTTTHGRLLTTISIDSGMKEKVAVVGQNMGIRKFAHVKLSLDILEHLMYNSFITVRNYDTMTTRGKQPKNIQLAYIAGLIDGEGTIGIYKKNYKSTSKAKPSFRERISISNSNLDVLMWIKEFFPKGSITKNTRYSDNHSPMFRLEYHVLKVIPILRATLPYLRIKKEQAKQVLKYRVNIKVILKTAKGKDRKLTDEEWNKRNTYYLLLKSLNKTGVQPQRLSEITSSIEDEATVRTVEKSTELIRNVSTP